MRQNAIGPLALAFRNKTMFHFCALVIVPPESPDPVQQVHRLLAPYNAMMEVEPYSTVCDCRSTGSDEAQAIQEETERRFSPYKPADPHCPDCHGSGTLISTDNPNGQWTGWQIGGRYTGALVSDYNPRQEMENQKGCELCGGTGHRPDIAYYADPEHLPTVNAPQSPPLLTDVLKLIKHHPLETPPIPPAGYQRIAWCSGCQGQGWRLQPSSQWKRFAGDLLPVRQIPANFFPYAIVLPTGEWLEQDVYSCWVTNVRPQWRQTVQEVFAQYADHIGAVVDCYG